MLGESVKAFEEVPIPVAMHVVSCFEIEKGEARFKISLLER